MVDDSSPVRVELHSAGRPDLTTIAVYLDEDDKPEFTLERTGMTGSGWVSTEGRKGWSRIRIWHRRPSPELPPVVTLTRKPDGNVEIALDIAQDGTFDQVVQTDFDWGNRAGVPDGFMDVPDDLERPALAAFQRGLDQAAASDQGGAVASFERAWEISEDCAAAYNVATAHLNVGELELEDLVELQAAGVPRRVLEKIWDRRASAAALDLDEELSLAEAAGSDPVLDAYHGSRSARRLKPGTKKALTVLGIVGGLGLCAGVAVANAPDVQVYSPHYGGY